MNHYRISDSARSDLEEIWIYIAQDDLVVADRFISKIVSQFKTLASMPEMGFKREDLLPQLRSFPIGNYVIFYRSIESGVEIVRVLHGARDYPPMFE